MSKTTYVWAVTAQYAHTTSDGYTGSRQAPTFFVDPNVQGSTTAEAARRVAEDILKTCMREMPVNDTLHITVEQVAR